VKSRFRFHLSPLVPVPGPAGGRYDPVPASPCARWATGPRVYWAQPQCLELSSESELANLRAVGRGAGAVDPRSSVLDVTFCIPRQLLVRYHQRANIIEEFLSLAVSALDGRWTRQDDDSRAVKP
jgi:hypothetical protein